MMKNEKDATRKKILDARQLALKISANSVYGFLGAYSGKYPFWPIPASTTSVGRSLIDMSKRSVEQKFNGADIIYGDTDSIMIHFQGCSGTMDGLKRSYEIGNKAADYLTDVIFGEHPSIVMEYEKSALWYLIWDTKKRYIMYKFETMDDILKKKGKIDMKGLEPVRSDNCSLSDDLYAKMISAMKNSERSLSKEEIRDLQISSFDEFMKKLIDDEYPLEDYIISKKVNKQEYANPTPHSEVFRKVNKRVEDRVICRVPYRVGDKVPFVIVQGNKKSKVCLRSEDPQWIRDHPKIKVDRSYYISNKLEKSIVKFCMYTVEDMQSRFNKVKQVIQNQEEGQRSIQSFFRPRKRPREEISVEQPEEEEDEFSDLDYDCIDITSY